MDKRLKEQRYKIERKILLKMFPSHNTLQSIATQLKMSRQAMSFKIKYLGLTNKWNDRKQEIIDARPPKSQLLSVLFCIYFVQNTNKKYYVTAHNFLRWREYHSRLLKKIFPNKNLQKDFNKYGPESLRVKIIKESADLKQLKLLKKTLIRNNLNCYNISIPFRTTKERYIDTMLLSPLRKSKHAYITWNRIIKKWKAQPVKNGKQFYLGHFSKELEAKKIVDKFFKGSK